jgi:NADPH2 dehydrogenase
MNEIRRVAALKTADDFLAYLTQIGVELPFDAELLDGRTSPLAQPLLVDGRRIGNRFAVLPMEGWDGTTDGRPTELTTRRWVRFGLSGAKLIWGGEAAAVRPDGRANPNQLMVLDSTVEDLAGLRQALVVAHAAHHGDTTDLLIGLQLTHSGRFARPVDQRLAPRTLYAHPLLDAKFHVDPAQAILHDDEIDALIDDFARAARLAQQAGFDFVDVKHCHGYLGHEFLSAVDRPGKYGGSFENRTRFLREVTSAIRRAAPGLGIGVRLSAFDFMPFQPDGTTRRGTPALATGESYPYAFGAGASGLELDLAEPHALLALLAQLKISLVCITAGSPYYNPHIQRPAFFPPSDGYLPPEDPLVGVARQIAALAALKRARPELIFVGSGYSYLQDWLPQVAQAVVRRGMVDVVGLGRMILSYPELPADLLAGRPLQRKRLCRTFSDCTTAPRNGMVSGCYPLDDFYKQRPEYAQLQARKQV